MDIFTLVVFDKRSVSTVSQHNFKDIEGGLTAIEQAKLWSQRHHGNHGLPIRNSNSDQLEWVPQAWADNVIAQTERYTYTVRPIIISTCE